MTTGPNETSYSVYDSYDQQSANISTLMAQVRAQPDELRQLQANPMVTLALVARSGSCGL